MRELPLGWTTSCIPNLISDDGLFSDGDWVESKDQDANGTIRLIQLADIGDGVFLDKSRRYVNEDKFTTLRCTEIFDDDVLLARMPDPLGRACMLPTLPQRCITVVDIAILRPGKFAVRPRWLMHFINSPAVRETIEMNSSGSTRRRISRGNLSQIEFPVPPHNEQKRIADKLDSLLARVDACRERLDRVPLVLKRFRQAVLAAATSGGLTEEWREKNSGCVGANRVRPGATSKNGADCNKGACHAPLQDRGEGEDLPEGWRWTSLAEVCESVVDCPHSTPKWTDTGKLCVRTTNFKPGVLDLSEKQYVSEITFNERIQRLRPMAGDIVYSREGGILGIACIIPSGVELCLGQRMMLFRTNSCYRSELLMYWLNSPQTLARVKVLTGGSASPHLNVRDIKNLPTPLPPLSEQHEIVRRVETLFAFADRLEARYTAARKQVDQLTPTLLAKAFRGELVPQDPNDEPAEKLLERIRTSQVTCGGTETKVRRRKTPVQK